MIDIVQWRSSIGVFNGCRGPSTTTSHGSSTHNTTNNCALHIPSLPIITIVSLLLILAGDIETNPGPVTFGELVDGLKGLVYWEMFAIHLPMISSSDIEKIARDYSGSTDRQKFHLYQLWLKRCHNAWNYVVQALHETRNHDGIALEIIEEKMFQDHRLRQFVTSPTHYIEPHPLRVETMVDINQWRASVGGWSCRCTSISWSVSNNKVKTNPTITDSVSILAGPATLSLVLVLVLLLVLSGDIELNPGPGGKPDKSDVFRFLRPHSSRWDDIASALNVNWDIRQGILQQGLTTTTQHKLEEVIHKWIESCCSEVTWDNLIKVLQSEELLMVNTAEVIESCLLNDAQMKMKYNWKKVENYKESFIIK